MGALKRLGYLAILALTAACGGEQAVDYYRNYSTEMMDTWPQSQITYNQGYNQFEYSDEGMQLAFSLNETEDYAFQFSLVNNSGGPVTIFWNQSAFVDINNVVHHVIHQTTTYGALVSSQRPTTIPAGASYSDLIQPAQEANRDGGPRFLPLTSMQLSNGSWGQRVTLLLQMNVDGQNRTHRFTFDLTMVQSPAAWGPYY